MPYLFGQKLRYIRDILKLTQADLAATLPASSQAHISNLEHGRYAPSIELVINIATVLGLSTDYLLRDDIPLETNQIFRSRVVSSQIEASFASNLSNLRRQAGFTQRQLASHLGLTSHVHISYLENDRKLPSLELVIRIADVFKVSTDQLLFRL